MEEGENLGKNMVTIEEIQKQKHSKPRGIKRDFESLKEKFNEISKAVRLYQQGKTKTKRFQELMRWKGFQELMRWNLARLITSAARLANSSNIRITEQFEMWSLGEPKIKKMETAKGYDIISKIYEGPSNLAFAAEGKKIIQLIGNVKGKNILDVGCGTGRYTVTLAKKGAEVHGIDISKGMLRVARKKSKRLGIKYRIVSMLKIPYRNNVFDIVISNLALDHVKNYKKALSEMLRVCNPKGKIVISTMHPDFIGKKKTIAPFVKGEIKVGIVSYRRDKGDFKKALKNRVKNLQFYELKIPKSAEKLNPLIYRWCKGKNVVLVMSMIKR